MLVVELALNRVDGLVAGATSARAKVTRSKSWSSKAVARLRSSRLKFSSEALSRSSELKRPETSCGLVSVPVSVSPDAVGCGRGGRLASGNQAEIDGGVAAECVRDESVSVPVVLPSKNSMPLPEGLRRATTAWRGFDCSGRC